MGCFGLRRLLYRLVRVALHMPQDNKRLALSWGEPFFVVVHLLYNRRLSWVVLAFAACFIAVFVLHYTCHKITKGSLYRGASLSLWWYTYYIIGGCSGLSWPSRLALSPCWCCITSVEGCKQPSPSAVSLFFINRKTFALKCPFSISQ